MRNPNTLRQTFEQRPLARRQRDLLVVVPRLASRLIDDEAAHTDQWTCLFGGSTLHRKDPRHEFVEIKRLYQIVIGAGVETLDPVAYLVRAVRMITGFVLLGEVFASDRGRGRRVNASRKGSA